MNDNVLRDVAKASCEATQMGKDGLDDQGSFLSDILPEQEYGIIEKYDLADLADCPIEAVTELLLTAAALIKEVSLSARRDKEITFETARQIAEYKMMIEDAERLLPFCPPLWKMVTITVDDDGSLTWLPNPVHS